jgi:N4-(beta-N-acetylglucosaminyl)-L-asparaginase
MNNISRRRFFRSGAGLGAAAFLFGGSRFSFGQSKGSVPVIITDHTNETGKTAVSTAFEILAKGGTALDAVEKGTNIIEVDPEDTSVGYGGLPNADGVVQLDSSIMDGKTYSAGAVGCLEGIKTPCSVARLVMEKTDHVMLVGEGALRFAKSFGYKEEDLMTEKSRRIWLRWRENLNKDDDWGPPDHLKKPGEQTAGIYDGLEHYTGTTNVLAVDSNGDIAGITSTSGLAWKIPGRVGDSPIIGAGLYVDNEVGAAGATGRGEDVIKSCASYFIVGQMRAGRSPQQACEDALQMILDRYKKVNPNFVPGEKFVALNKKGEYGCAIMPGPRVAEIVVVNESGMKVHAGSAYK